MDQKDREKNKEKNEAKAKKAKQVGNVRLC